MSQSWSRHRVEKERGFPAFCRKCGEAAVVFTSKSLKNPDFFMVVLRAVKR